MWHTSQGDRTLRGAEATLVRTAIESMVDNLLVYVDTEAVAELEHDDSGSECGCGIAVYDALTLPQRIAVLHDVAKYLLTDTDNVLALSAELEAAVAAIFVEIRDQVAIEITFRPPDDEGPSWRSLVLAAYQNVRANDNEDHYDDDLDQDIPTLTDSQMHRWEYLIESLTDAILWDRDFEMADSFLDDDPGVSHARRRLLGIDDEYFTSIAHDPRPDEVRQLVSRTRQIVRAKPR